MRIAQPNIINAHKIILLSQNIYSLFKDLLNVNYIYPLNMI